MKNASLSLLTAVVLLMGCDRYETITCPYYEAFRFVIAEPYADTSVILVKRYNKNSRFNNPNLIDSVRLEGLGGYHPNWDTITCSFDKESAKFDLEHQYNYDWSFTYLPTMQEYRVDQMKPSLEHDERVVGTNYSGACRSTLDSASVNGTPHSGAFIYMHF